MFLSLLTRLNRALVAHSEEALLIWEPPIRDRTSTESRSGSSTDHHA